MWPLWKGRYPHAQNHKCYTFLFEHLLSAFFQWRTEAQIWTPAFLLVEWIWVSSWSQRLTLTLDCQVVDAAVKLPHLDDTGVGWGPRCLSHLEISTFSAFHLTWWASELQRGLGRCRNCWQVGLKGTGLESWIVTGRWSAWELLEGICGTQHWVSEELGFVGE